MTPSPSISGNATVDTPARIERSRQAIEDFLRHQREWIRRAEDALRNGYFIETIGIAINQIHAILRRGLWLQSQIQSLEEHPRVWRDSYLFELLQEPTHDMMESAQDQQLYGAAQRFGVIDEDTGSRLHRLYEDAKITQRVIFSRNAHEKVHPAPRTIAEKILAMDKRCLDELEKRFKEFDAKISALLRELAR